VSLLHKAIEQDDLEGVRRLVESGDDVDARDEVECTPLHWAGAWGRIKAAELLLEHNADPDARDRLGQTPLHKAADYGHLGAIELFLDRGADINARDEINATPLYWASTKSNGGPHPTVMRFLRARGGTE
jgi:ankyrin repeat protein